MNAETAIDFQITLEERVSKIYQKIGEHFSSESGQDKEWVDFWGRLAADESNHASILSIEKTFLHSGTHLKSPLEINPEDQKVLDAFLSECEGRLHSGITQKEAIEILTALESSGEGKTFSSLLKATDSKVLDHVANFSLSQKEHDRRVKEAILKYGSA